MVAEGFNNETLYAFIIETDKYTGNFERELCAYATGMTGDCEVGHRQAKMFEEEVDHTAIDSEDDENPLFDGIVIGKTDDHGCYRPCTIWEGDLCDDEGYNAVAIFFDCDPASESERRGDLIKIMKERSIEYSKIRKNVIGDSNPFNILGFRLVKMERTWTETKIDIGD